jgi:hypothetical protein
LSDEVNATLRVYSRPGCHLCEQLVEELLPLVRDKLAVEVVDVESRPEWLEEYALRIPVVEYDGQFICQYQLDTGAVRQLVRDLHPSRGN